MDLSINNPFLSHKHMNAGLYRAVNLLPTDAYFNTNKLRFIRVWLHSDNEKLAYGLLMRVRNLYSRLLFLL